MFTSRTGRWPSIHWPNDAIWTTILPLDGYGAYVTPIMVFVLYPSYKPLCIEVIFCTLEISSKELGFFNQFITISQILKEIFLRFKG